MALRLKPQIILLAGPTASGKSAVAVKLALRLAQGGKKAEIVNADSMQVYSELRVLTARPSSDEQGAVPHHLFGVASVSEAYSVARWCGDAAEAIAAINARGNIAIVAGGTGLYFDALLNGLSAVPEIPAAIREEARALAAADSAAAHQLLEQEDPGMAATLAPGDSQRIARALEVVRATGRSLSHWQAETVPGPLAAGDKAGEVAKFVLMPPRAEIYARCEARFDRMVAEGGLEEVAALPKGSPDLPAFKALGVPELQASLAGTMTAEEAIDRAKTLTRQYAKRQMTWFRNRFGDWHHIDEKETDKIADIIFSKISKNSLTA